MTPAPSRDSAGDRGNRRLLRDGALPAGMSWADLFDRASEHDADMAAVRAAVDERRAERRDGAGGDPSDVDSADESDADDRPEPGPARIVADADVLAADLLVGGPAREALDHARRHSWVALVASDPLLDDAEAGIAALASDSLAAEWRDRIEAERERATHPAGDHPALASALHGGAMHVLTTDEGLQSAAAGAAVRSRVETSVKSPDAFARLFDPASLYAAVEGGEYPGPDREPRA